jgi:predicted permease
MTVPSLVSEALRERRRDWRVTAAFCGVLGSALAVAAACISLAWPLLWESLPFPDASRIAAICSAKKGVAGGVSWGDANDLRERVPSIERVAVYSARTWGVQTEQHGHVEVLLSAMVTGEFFEVLGLRPSLAATENEVWLTDAAATRLFGRSETALNGTLWINAAPYRVTGVLPAQFRFPMAEGAPDLIIPLARADYCCARGGGAQQAIARLRDPGRFGAELRVASNALAAEFPATNSAVQFVPVSFREHLFGPRLPAVRWILAGALCLVLIAAANGSGIWMARWLKVRRDAAIRLSLGASAARLAAIRATEGALAGLVAGAFGVALATMLLRVLDAVPLLHERLQAFAVWRPLSLAPPAIATALGAGVCAGLMAALLPHLAVMVRLLREGTRESMSAHPAARRVRLVLTAVQLSVTAILGWTAIAIGQNVHTLLTAPRGFETAQTLIAGIGVPEARYNTDEKMTAFHDAVIAHLQAVPGVSAAAGGAQVPQSAMRTRFLRDGETLPRERQPIARIGVASSGLLPLLGVPVRRGRGFTADDRWGAPRVALVNEAFVRAYLADAADPLREGLRPSFYNGFAMKPYTRFQIVGIIADTRNDAMLVEPQPQIVIPAAQIAMEGFVYYVKTPLPAASMNSGLREAIWAVDPAIERVTFRPLDDYLDRGLAERRALGGFGLAVALLAALIVGAGLYASLAASLIESGKELAIRAALGATPARLAMESMRWALLAVGVAGAVTAVAVPFVAASVQLEKAVLRATPSSAMMCLLAMGIIMVAAAFRPVWKAAFTAPVEVLRAE